MNLLREIFSPDFLLRNSLYASILVGLTLPVLGSMLYLRRMTFFAITVPQVSSTGIALALSIHVWTSHSEEAHDPTQQHWALAGSLLLTMLTAVFLAFRRKAQSADGTMGLLFVTSMAASLLLLAKCPAAERGWFHLLKGEIVAVPQRDLLIAAITLTLGTALLLTFKRDLYLVAFDPDLAKTIGKSAPRWNLFFYLLSGLMIAISVILVGPLITFGFLLLPCVAAHRLAGGMTQFLIYSLCFGLFSGITGFLLAYQFDLPIGPTQVGVMALFGVISPLLPKR